MAIILFIIGVLGGLTVGALVVHGCFPPPPAPLYEDIEISTVKCEVNENVAYGITS